MRLYFVACQAPEDNFDFLVAARTPEEARQLWAEDEMIVGFGLTEPDQIFEIQCAAVMPHIEEPQLISWHKLGEAQPV